jgi:ubiquinone/menaquinone biosynthesis C-methylase UbiE
MFTKPGEIVKYLKDKKYITTNMNGADFGCGSGYFSVLLAQSVLPSGTIYAIDILEDELKSAQEFANNLGVKNIRFLRQDLEKNSGLANNQVDFVFISQVLYQSKEPQKIIKEAFRVIKNNGFLIVYEPQASNFLFSGQKVHSQEEIEKICTEIGFKILERKEYPGFYLLVFQK